MVHVHPGDAQQANAFRLADVCHPVQPYRVRNFEMVNLSNVLWATPGRNHEELRSGTWMTIRYAKKIGKKLVIIWPNGEPCED